MLLWQISINANIYAFMHVRLLLLLTDMGMS